MLIFLTFQILPLILRNTSTLSNNSKNLHRQLPSNNNNSVIVSTDDFMANPTTTKELWLSSQMPTSKAQHLFTAKIQNAHS